MDLGLEQFAYLDSPIHRWEARTRLVGLLALIFAFSFVQQMALLPMMGLVTAVLFLLSRLPITFWFNRLRYPGIFLLAVAVLLPFFSGQTVLWQLGPLALRQEGLLEFLLIFVKFVCILTISLVLFGAAPFLTTIKAMRALRLPPILADMLLLTYRYIFELGHDLRTMERAMRLRGFAAGRLSARGARALAAVAGTLLVRSYEQSERVYQAMVLRGYGQTVARPADGFMTTGRDWAALTAVLLVALGFVLAEAMLG
ncbi:MAG: cobalt ECF transporter T component CbiQ [Chloroflexi bacterium]|nr:cobalt ECF transporter T component CbiQ [Chloroflexota bacterium]